MSWIRVDRHVMRSLRGERQIMGLKREEYSIGWMREERQVMRRINED
jgi:hypothetical protein